MEKIDRLKKSRLGWIVLALFCGLTIYVTLGDGILLLLVFGFIVVSWGLLLALTSVKAIFSRDFAEYKLEMSKDGYTFMGQVTVKSPNGDMDIDTNDYFQFSYDEKNWIDFISNGKVYSNPGIKWQKSKSQTPETVLAHDLSTGGFYIFEYR